MIIDSPYSLPAVQIPGTPLMLHAGVIRMETPLEPYIHINAGHYCLGLEGVSLVDGELRVELEKGVDETLRAVTNVCEEDESMSQAGISCGGSGGNSHINIRFRIDNTPVRADDPRLYKVNRNIWFQAWTLKASCLKEF